ncbi:PilZ domain-containing protein [Pseudaminobacter sp. NGMCC 1.201702]|uniref:PilZ domain-containing protein n=1 Tax=Pseudaminobacter sp. NGMCC 1.201702 TaxID=3391825 RepID=UPI0039EFC948
MADANETDMRREHRRRVLKGASILTGISNSEIKCVVRNMHQNGAELDVPVGAPVPAEFLLYVPIDGIAYRSTVVWRKDKRIGVSFSGKEPKPSWHYG